MGSLPAPKREGSEVGMTGYRFQRHAAGLYEKLVAPLFAWMPMLTMLDLMPNLGFFD